LLEKLLLFNYLEHEGRDNMANKRRGGGTNHHDGTPLPVVGVGMSNK
jgi:hypothetical protein